MVAVYIRCVTFVSLQLRRYEYLCNKHYHILYHIHGENTRVAPYERLAWQLGYGLVCAYKKSTRQHVQVHGIYEAIAQRKWA